MEVVFVDREGVEGRIMTDFSIDYQGSLPVDEFLQDWRVALLQSLADDAGDSKAMGELMIQLHEELDVKESWIDTRNERPP